MISENSKENLRLFQEMVQCIYNVSFWTFDASFNIIKADCEMPSEMLNFFSFEAEQIRNLIIHENNLSSVVLTNQLSMIWIVDFEPDSSGKAAYVHLIGPVFTEPQSTQTIKNKMFNLTLSDTTRKNFSSVIDHIPIIPLSHFLEYGIMMHYCITGEKITVSDFSYITSSKDDSLDECASPNKRIPNSWASWMTEQKMFAQIEAGNLHYKDYVNELSYKVPSNHIGNGNSLRQAKNLTIIFTSLCARAAIRGGLDPDIAYDLSDRYINSIESCKNIPGVAEINSIMQDDFVKRVHRCRSEQNISPQIQKCCAYIQLHLGEQITLAQLSKYIGYSESHLSKKFKEDTGKTIKEYIMDCRIEQAKQLLHTSSLQIADICEQLGFTSQSYFGSQFRKATGMTPSAYRNSLLESFVEGSE